jgi:hypothetical protein
MGRHVHYTPPADRRGEISPRPGGSGQAPPARTPRPRPPRVRPKNIPDRLKDLDQWVVWKYVWNPDKRRKDGSGLKGDWDKPPSNARTGGRASSTDRATWCDFKTALRVYIKGGWDGIGFVPLPEDLLTITDLDSCRNPGTGVIEARALAIVSELKTYTEISPSGTGLRIVASGHKPDNEWVKRGDVEMYDGHTKAGKPGGRYLTFTGHLLEGSRRGVRRCPNAIARVYRRELLGKTAAEPAPEPSANLDGGAGGQTAGPPANDEPQLHDLNDDQLIAKAKAAKNGAKFSHLWGGNWSGYTSESEADLALCSLLAFWCQGDPDGIDRLFRKSGRYRKDKWEREDYREGTIAKALEGKGEFYKPGGKEKKKSQATQLVEYVVQEGTAPGDSPPLWHTPGRVAYATVPVTGHFENYPVYGEQFKAWLRHLYYDHTGKPIGRAPLDDAVGMLAARAIYDGPEHEAHVRLASHEGKVYLDLADADWRAVEIDARGWRVVATPPVRFRRAPGMLPLPDPVPGSVEELRPFVNVTDAEWPLLVAWLVGALHPSGPFTVLAINGEQGSAKTTLSGMIRKLLDPNTAPTRAIPREVLHVSIAAQNGWLVSYNNLSDLPGWLSDTLCRINAGEGFSTRTYYTTGDETIFVARRPVCLNGIEQIVTAPDLLDRCLLLTLPPIPEGSHRTEKEIWAAFDAALPRILGGFLSAVSVGLRNLPTTRLKRLPRMADFALWVAAACPGLGITPKEFLRAYRANRRSAVETALEASPVAAPLLQFLDRQEGEWSGTAAELLEALTLQVGEQAARSREWPKRPHVLGGRLHRLAPALRKAGVEVEFVHDGRQRTISLNKKG